MGEILPTFYLKPNCLVNKSCSLILSARLKIWHFTGQNQIFRCISVLSRLSRSTWVALEHNAMLMYDLVSSAVRKYVDIKCKLWCLEEREYKKGRQRNCLILGRAKIFSYEKASSRHSAVFSRRQGHFRHIGHTGQILDNQDKTDDTINKCTRKNNNLWNPPKNALRPLLNFHAAHSALIPITSSTGIPRILDVLVAKSTSKVADSISDQISFPGCQIL